MREGDTLVVTKPDRLARSTADLLANIKHLDAKGVALPVLSMGGQELDTSSSTGKLMLTLLEAVAEFERDLMLERQREGIAKAKADGKFRGRAPTARARTAAMLHLRGEGVKPREIAGQLKIRRQACSASWLTRGRAARREPHHTPQSSLEPGERYGRGVAGLSRRDASSSTAPRSAC